MAVPEMKLVLETLVAEREGWSLSANATFLPGVHLVSGDVGSGKSTLAQIIAGFEKPYTAQSHAKEYNRLCSRCSIRNTISPVDGGERMCLVGT